MRLATSLRVLLTAVGAVSLGYAVAMWFRILSTAWLFASLSIVAVLAGTWGDRFQRQSRAPPDRNSLRFWKLGAVGFFAFASLALLFVQTTRLHYKPDLYFLLAGLAGAFLALQLSVGSLRKPGRVAFTLLEIVALGLLLRFSTVVLSPDFVWGPDSYWHVGVVERILAEGRMSVAAGHYYYYFSFHMLLVPSMLVLGPSPVSFSAVGPWVSVIGILFVFLASREMMNTRCALWASLFYAVATFSLFGAINHSAMTFGFAMVFAVLWVGLRSRRSGMRRQYLISAWLIAVFVFFIHPVTSLVLLVLVTAFTLRWPTRGGQEATWKVIGPGSYGVAFLAYLLFIYFALFRSIVVAFFGEVYTPPTYVVGPRAVDLDALQVLFAFAGLALTFFFAASGVWRWVEGNRQAERRFVIFLLVIAAILPVSLFGLAGDVEPTRFLQFAALTGTVPAGLGFHAVLVRYRAIPTAAMSMGVVLLLVVASSGSYLTWDATKLFNDRAPVPNRYPTTSLVSAGSYLSLVPPWQPILVDPTTFQYVVSDDRGLLGLPNPSYSIGQLQTFGGDASGVVLAWNAFYWDRPAPPEYGDQMDLIYSSGSIEIFRTSPRG